jgi:hypothetical protein
MGQSLTISAVLMCPHGGTVKIVASNPASASNTSLATIADTFTVAGCPFAPGGVPSPCISVQWSKSDSKVKVGGNATLSLDSVGICQSGAGAPQGPVLISQTQSDVKST